MLVTTSYEPTAELFRQAKALSERLHCSWVPRRKYSMPQLRSKYKASSIVLVTKEGIKYYVEEYPPIFFHPSTGAVRIKRLLKGEPDILLNVSGIASGDTVLDCTAGLASDSIVFSYAVGEKGRVVALESEEILAFLLQEGLQSYESEIQELNAAMRRIQVQHAEHGEYLKRMDSQSVDVIYFDPMFRSPIEESSSISPLREIANAEAISLQAMDEAKRVARKCIVMKEHRESREFARLGFQHVVRSNTKIAYGVIRC